MLVELYVIERRKCLAMERYHENDLKNLFIELKFGSFSTVDYAIHNPIVNFHANKNGEKKQRESLI